MDCLKQHSYLRHAARGGLGPLPPDGVYQQPDGFWYHQTIHPVHGTLGAVRVCEDCWHEIPPYDGARYGFVSPESDKSRPVTFSGEHNFEAGGQEQIAKTVCRECYLSAFQRVYPGADLPALPDIHPTMTNIVEWTATNQAPTVLHLDAQDPMRKHA